MHKLKYFFAITLAVLTGITSGCATIKGPTDPNDPFESYNRSMHKFNQRFDKSVAVPVAETYQNVTPTWLDKGITRFFSNLGDLVVLTNNLLQFKLKHAASDTTRIIVNTTVGILGFFDPATKLNLRKHREDFGQTLGYWGIPAGPYFVIPFLGPSSIRDSVGRGADYMFFDPTVSYVDNVTARNSLLTVNYIDKRADFLGITKLIDTMSLDHYTFTREAYLSRRRYFVYDGNPPVDDFEEME